MNDSRAPSVPPRIWCKSGVTPGSLHGRPGVRDDLGMRSSTSFMFRYCSSTATSTDAARIRPHHLLGQFRDETRLVLQARCR